MKSFSIPTELLLKWIIDAISGMVPDSLKNYVLPALTWALETVISLFGKAHISTFDATGEGPPEVKTGLTKLVQDIVTKFFGRMPIISRIVNSAIEKNLAALIDYVYDSWILATRPTPVEIDPANVPEPVPAISTSTVLPTLSVADCV